MKTIFVTGALAVFCVWTVAMHSVDNLPRQTTIVAQREFKNQRGDIKLTTLFIPATAGVYRISIDVETNYEPAGGNGPEPIAYWTDDFSAYQSQIVITGVETNGTSEETGQLIVRDVANKPIQLSVLGNDNGQGRYNVYVVIEKL